MRYAKTTAYKKIKQLTKRIRAVPGGSSASKTVSIILYLIACAQNDKTPTVTSIVSESIPHLKRGAMRDFKNILKAHNYWKDANWNVQDSTYTFETGSIIEFFSTDNGDKLRGARRDRCFMNEANNCTFEAFEQLEIRTKDFFFLDWNPTNEFFYYTEIKDKRVDVEELTLTYLDNEALDPQIITSLEQRKHRTGWWKVYGLGQLGEVEGRIYSGWNEITEIPNEARLERYGVDFGYHPDPAAIVALYYYNGGYILDEITYQIEMSNREMAETLKNLPRALIVADSAEPKSIAELKMYGLNVVPTLKGKDSKKYGIKAVQDQRMSITKNSTNLLKEYRNYLWATDRDGKILPGIPEDGNDHLLDASMYAINSLIPVIKRKELFKELRLPPRQKTNIGV